jgi:hypothetical protein
MNEYDDISESVPQGVNGEKEKEDSRIQEISDELDRRCRIHEAQSEDSQGYATPFEIKKRNNKSLAKRGFYIDIPNKEARPITPSATHPQAAV